MIKRTCLSIALAACGGKTAPPPAKPADPPPQPIVATSPPTPDVWPPECMTYKAAVEKLIACDKFPADSRDALKQSLIQMAEAFKQITPNSVQGSAQAIIDACKQGADAIAQASTS